MLLENYKNEQPVASKTLLQAIKNNKISHAYLFETNDYSKTMDFILSFVKDIITYEMSDDTYCKNICNQIDNNEYIELKIICTQGLQIKKDEMLNLQDEFKNKSIEGQKKIYIIKEAGKLNSSSSNTILKFLEEPEENIIAILVTDNRYQLIDTIISRCQLVSLKCDNNNGLDTIEKIKKTVYNEHYAESDLVKEKVERTINFLLFYEEKKIETLLFLNREFIQFFNTREEIVNSLEIMKLFYLDTLKNKAGSKVEIFNNYLDKVELCSKKNTISNLIYKINKIIYFIERIKYNLNLNLLMDSFIIELGDEYND